MQIIAGLVSKMQHAQTEGAQEVTLPIRDLLMLVDLYYDARDEIADLEDEINMLIREQNADG